MKMYSSIKSSILLYTLIVLLSLNIKAQGIIITSGTFMATNSTGNIVINNAGFKNNGAFSAANGTVIFTGNAATVNSFISGTSTSTFNNLTLNKTLNGLQLNSNIIIKGTLNLLSGDSLFLNNHNIDLDTSGIISGEINSRRITGLTGGYIRISKTLSAPVAVNPGNIGIEITSSANMGSTVIQRGHMQQSGASVYRYFNVSPTNNTGLNASIKFHYFHAELAGIPEENLGAFSSSNGGTSWTLGGSPILDSIQDYITVAGLDNLNRVTLANMHEPLSVKLLYLKAKWVGKQIFIEWATGAEPENDHFEVERSTDGINFIRLISVNSLGNNPFTQYYSYTDQSPEKRMNYYRIKEVDINNHYTYSYTVSVKAGSNEKDFVNIYPNPAESTTKFSFMMEEENNYRIQISDMNGKIMQSKMVHCIAGLNEIEWNVSALPSGVYNIGIVNKDFKSRPLFKK